MALARLSSAASPAFSAATRFFALTRLKRLTTLPLARLYFLTAFLLYLLNTFLRKDFPFLAAAAALFLAAPNFLKCAFLRLINLWNQLLYFLAFARALPLILLNQPRAFLWYLDFSFLALLLTLLAAARILALILAIIDLNLDLAIFFPFALSMATWALALAMKPLAFAFSLALMAFTLALALETCFFTNLLAAATFFLAKPM